MTNQDLLQLLSQVDQLSASIKKLLVEETPAPEPVAVVASAIEPIAVPTPTPVVPAILAAANPLLSLLSSPNWPAATNIDMICALDSEEDKVDRAKGILDLMIETRLQGKRFLDYGCGEGHCVFEALKNQPAAALGFDIKSHSKWNQDNFTTDFSVVKAASPFGVILLFDVLDHPEKETPLEILKKAASLLAPDGELYVRFHPFTSRHATHAYHTINKAFIHLVFSHEELGINPGSYIPNAGVVRPIMTYESYIKDAGLRIKSRKDTVENVEDFFRQNNEIAGKMMESTKLDKFPEFQCSLQFVDYILQK